MPDGIGGAGIGAGGGAVAAAVVYALDRWLGSGRAVKNLDDRFKELREALQTDISSLRQLAERATAFAERLHDWHNVADPDDPSGKLWYFSVSMRRLLDSLQTKVSKLLELLDQLVRRFDKYNNTMEKLITVVEQLQKDVNALGLMVSGMNRRP